MPKEVPKFGVPEFIQFVGVNELAPEEQETVSRLSTQCFEKLQRFVENLEGMAVHVKTYQSEGKKKKFSIHVKVKAPTKKQIDSTKSHDFDLARALHKAFEDVLAQAKHSFHSDTTRPKAYE